MPADHVIIIPFPYALVFIASSVFAYALMRALIRFLRKG